MTLDQAMQMALGYHQAGRLAEAEAIYRQVLEAVPDHAGALNLLGLLAGQTGHTEQALGLIGRAIAIAPGVAEYHGNLGELHRRSGRPDDAITCFRRAIALKPELAGLHINLGNALHDAGRNDEAIAAYRTALERDPDDFLAWTNLGVALHDLGRSDEAIAAHERAIQLRPDCAEPHNNLGNALREQKRLDAAVAAYERAIRLRPSFAEAYDNLGVALKDQGRLEQALAAQERAIALEPGNARAHCNRGVALAEQGRFHEAIASYRRALAERPSMVEAHTNLGNALRETGEFDLALAAQQQALALRPGDAEAANNLGSLLRDAGRIDDALTAFGRALDARPDFAQAASNRLLTLYSHPGYDAQAILAEHRAWARRHADPVAGEIRPHPNDRSLGRLLRIGYVSPDFRDHPVGRMLLALLANHDRRHFEVNAYSDVRAADSVTAQLRALTNTWRDTAGLSDTMLAAAIRADRIDILVDLALHTAGNRMLVFARKPAPVQATMLGLPATTGLATIDYRLTDPYVDPPGAGDQDYSEQSIRLPHCYWIFPIPEEAPPVAPLPALGNGFVTFGCLNQFAKVTIPVLELWVRILQALPAAHLLIQAHPGQHLHAARTLFEQGGIASERVRFVPGVPRPQYFERFGTIDVGLDPFPYNGHTSTLDALWMGVPVVTLAGRTAVGRGGVSILSKIGLSELIARTSDEYVAITLGLARDRARLADLRAGLRQMMKASPLVDAKQYAADVETALRVMWRTWCGGAIT
jgi:predicted O-linked N-acetylglucosamine transferase (SPINDLY family)